MRRSQAAVALIRRPQGDNALWLAQWNPKWQAFHFVGGHKRPSETFRECVVREVAEELRLSEQAEFSAAREPILHLEYSAWSESANAETCYMMELFEVELTDAARRRVETGSENCWLTEAEIHAEQTLHGQRVSATMNRLLGELSRKS
jgi:8-oxo-dGTP pyrophosphatase MutT (NUDIX family)